MTKHIAPCGTEFDTPEDARSHELLCDQCAGATERRCAHCGAHVSPEGAGVWLDAMDDSHCEDSATGHHEAEVVARPGGVTRYLLVEVDLPDGSHGTADPERAFAGIETKVRDYVSALDVSGVSVEQVYPGDVVAEDDLVDFDTAEAAGLDGTGRDGDPRFPYTAEDLSGKPARDYPFMGMTPASFDYAVEMGEAWHAGTVNGSRYDFRIYLGPIPKDYRTDDRAHGWTVVAVPTKPARKHQPGWKSRKTTAILVHRAHWDEDLTAARMVEPHALAARLADADLHIVADSRQDNVPAYIARLLAWTPDQID